MKKYFIILAAALFSASCSTVLSTSTHENADAFFRPTISVADVRVSDTKISYTYIPTRQVRKGGVTNVIDEAVRQALRSSGNYDVLVAKETCVTVKGTKIRSVVVTGYPGYYTNWRSTEELVPVKEKKSRLFGKRFRR